MFNPDNTNAMNFAVLIMLTLLIRSTDLSPNLLCRCTALLLSLTTDELRDRVGNRELPNPAAS